MAQATNHHTESNPRAATGNDLAAALFSLGVVYYPRYRDGTLGHQRQAAHFVGLPTDPWAWARTHYDTLASRDHLPGRDLIVDVLIREATGWHRLPRPTWAFQDLCAALLADPEIGATIGRDDARARAEEQVP
ncbi:MAG: hypothetical protein WD673_01700 [Alphaproteobacteria bacterium]